MCKRVPTFKPRVAGPPRSAPAPPPRRDADAAKLQAEYSSSRWQRFRRAIRRERVLCERCQAEGRVEFGVVVHHVVDPRDDWSGLYDPNNVKLWCVACHNRHHKSRDGKAASRARRRT